MFNELQPNNFETNNQSQNSVYRLELNSGLRNLTRNYWAIIDEENVNTVKQQIASITDVVKTDSSSVEAQFEPAANKEIMVNDLIRISGNKSAKQFIK